MDTSNLTIGGIQNLVLELETRPRTEAFRSHDPHLLLVIQLLVQFSVLTCCVTSASLFLQNRGLLLGIYQDETNGEFTLKKAAQSFQSKEMPGLSKLIIRYCCLLLTALDSICFMSSKDLQMFACKHFQQFNYDLIKITRYFNCFPTIANKLI